MWKIVNLKKAEVPVAMQRTYVCIEPVKRPRIFNDSIESGQECRAGIFQNQGMLVCLQSNNSLKRTKKEKDDG